MAETIDCSAVLSQLTPALNEDASARIYWTASQMYDTVDRSVKRLARATGAFVTRDTSLLTIDGQGPYTLPARHLATIQLEITGTVNGDAFASILRPATMAEIEALDEEWPDTEGEPGRYVADEPATDAVRLYPAPDTDHAGLQIGLIRRVYAEDVSSGSPLLAAPTCVREYLYFASIAELRAKESKAAMPEVSAWAGSIASLVEDVIKEYWGD